MTTCSAFANAIRKRVDEGKDLDTIAEELCQDVKFGRQKIIRTIKNFFGKNFLQEHKNLGYDAEKARLAEKRTSHKKIDANTDSDSCESQSTHVSCDNSAPCGSQGGQESSNRSISGNVLDSVRALVKIFGLNRVREAIESILSETPKDAIQETSSIVKYPTNHEAIENKTKSPSE